MKIYSDPTRDGRSPKPRPGAYEWWYFDGMGDDGVHSFVIIFYDGNPFSKHYMKAAAYGGLASDHPALSVSVYREGLPVYYSFTEYHPDDVRWHGQDSLVSFDMAGQTLRQERRGNRWGYVIRIDQTLDSGYRLRADLDMESESLAHPLLQASEPSAAKPDALAGNRHSGMDHAWNLVMARARVRGGLEIDQPGTNTLAIDMEGLGYHDHNVGWEPMKDSFKDWYWGRFHGAEGEMVHYVMRDLEGGIRPAAWLNIDGIPYESISVAMVERSLTKFGLFRYETLRFSFDHGIQAIVKSERCIDDGPFYQRFISSLDISGSDRAHMEWRGITEYIRPDRIHKKIFWPLVDMRIRYSRHSPHWVQRIPELYRATW
jgi:carotenoid 1,2-hydratase